MALVAQQEGLVTPASWEPLELRSAATMDPDLVLGKLGSRAEGLSSAEAARRLDQVGPNALRTHRARPLTILLRQLRNPLLVILVTTALVSAFVGEGTDAFIILSIICLSVVLGFFNEYRSARAVEALHSQLRHTALALRDDTRPVGTDRAASGASRLPDHPRSRKSWPGSSWSCTPRRRIGTVS